MPHNRVQDVYLIPGTSTISWYPFDRRGLDSLRRS